MTKIAQPNSTLKRDPAKALRADPDTTREFVERGRRNSKMGKVRRPVAETSIRQKRAVRDAICLGCGKAAVPGVRKIDPAHIWPTGRGGDCGSRFDVFPLCRYPDGSGCHREFDEGRLDLLSAILADWQRWFFHFVHALRHADGPVQLLERLAGARVAWSGARAAGSRDARERGSR